jgi:hypothetical protein
MRRSRRNQERCRRTNRRVARTVSAAAARGPPASRGRSRRARRRPAGSRAPGRRCGPRAGRGRAARGSPRPGRTANMRATRRANPLVELRPSGGPTPSSTAPYRGGRPSRVRGRERAAGERHDLQSPARSGVRCLGSTTAAAAASTAARRVCSASRSDGGQLRLQLRAQHRIRARGTPGRPPPPARTTPNLRPAPGATGAAQVLDDRPRRPLVGRDGGGLGDVEDVEQVVGTPARSRRRAWPCRRPSPGRGPSRRR